MNARSIYYPHVEGLRGVLALYVFLYHIWQTGIAHAGATMAPLLAVTPFLQFGHFAVSGFIVISGYCLALPLAMHPSRRFYVRAFARRRLRRLGPAYLLVLIASLAPFYATEALRGHHVPFSHVAIALAMHLGLVHNLVPATMEYLNGPMWSIGLECQIYVVFAVLLVPVWRRFGALAQLALALGLGLFPQLALHGALSWTAPWFLALFALGVVAAQLTARDLPRIPWTALALAAGAAALPLVLTHGDAADDGSLWPADLAVGLCVALTFVATRDGRPLVARLLAARPVEKLGTFSYSLYLVHGPLVLLAGAALLRFHAGLAPSLATYALLIPAVVALAYGVYLVAERPFLNPAFRAAIEAAEQSGPEVMPELVPAPAAVT